MRTPNTPLDRTFESIRQESHEAGVVYSSQLAYHEMAEVPVRETDLLEQLHSNLHQLEDLQARLRFMMKEIRYLMKV